MLDHIGIAVSDYARSKRFYAAALAPLGLTLIMEPVPEQGESGAGACGFGTGRKPFFWIGAGSAVGHSHVAFAVPDRATVDAFHKTAIAAGARDNGAPGLRAHYHPDYYGAFVLDPDGHNIEAICHAPE